jgi:hypothetical protein
MALDRRREERCAELAVSCERDEHRTQTFDWGLVEQPNRKTKGKVGNGRLVDVERERSRGRPDATACLRNAEASMAGS